MEFRDQSRDAAPPTRRKVVLLGSTGSIGTQAIDVVDAAPERFEVTALAAGGGQLELVARQAVHTRAQAVGIASGTVEELSTAIKAAAEDAALAGYSPQLFAGPDAAARTAAWEDADVVLNGITGSIGLAPTLAALEAGHVLALANKESLIAGGPLVKAAAGPGQIVPVDSEHSALAQALRAGTAGEVDRLIVTASGGPFRGFTRRQLAGVTPAQALAHPTWDMGRMVTTNSASMVNKALEVIEAHFLFGLPYDRIEVVVHPQSIVHSFVEFIDGSVVAQMGLPSMELPVLYALTHPDRAEDDGLQPFDPVAVSPLTFERVDVGRFPALRLGIEAGRRGGAAPAVYNAANEQAVALFLAGRIRFGDIPRGIESALASLGDLPGGSRDELIEADARARRHVMELI